MSVKNNNLQLRVIGMKLKDVKQLHPEIRIVAFGDTKFMHTADYRPNRLNLFLSSTKKVKSFMDLTNEDKQEAVVVKATWG